MWRLWALAQLAEAEEDWDRLTQALSRLVRADSNGEVRSVLLLRLASVYWHRIDDLELATSALEAAVNENPNHLNALATLGRLYAQRSDWRSASRVLDRLMPRAHRMVESEHIDILRLRGRCAMENGEYSLAKQTLLAVLELSPDDELALGMLRDISFETKQWRQAISFGLDYLKVAGEQLGIDEQADRLSDRSGGRIAKDARANLFSAESRAEPGT